MILHIATDEKFINAANSVFEAAFPRINHFYILSSNSDELKHVELRKNVSLLPDDNFLSEIEIFLNPGDIMVFHGMSLKHSLISNRFSTCKQVWCVFGKEFYENPFLNQDILFGNETKSSILGLQHKIKKFLKPIYYKIFSHKLNPNKIIAQSFKNIDYIAVLYEEEYSKLIKSNAFKDNVSFVKFTYYPFDLIIKDDKIDDDANNILIGNSATASNNHLEVFRLIDGKRPLNQKLIVPLSYGNKSYSNRLVKVIEREGVCNVEFLLSFLSLGEYQKILKSCCCVIMNHYRQQAVGNVLNCVAIGAKVFLSKKNTLYHYLKRIGCYVYTIEEDLVSDSAIFEKMDPVYGNHNKKILLSELSLDAVINHLRDSFKELVK